MSIYTGNDLARDIARNAASKNVDRLLKAWDDEIQAAFDALRARGEKLEQLKRQETAEALRQAHQEAADRALSEAVGNYLEGLAIQARNNDSSAVSVPAGFRAASLVLAGAPIAELQALIGDIADDVNIGRADSPVARAQQSAAWALGQGLSPHPGDLASLLQGHGVDRQWTSHFQELAGELDRIDASRFRHTQLQGHSGHARLELLGEHVRSLKAYGSDRLVDLVTRPSSLSGTRAPQDPPASAAAARTGGLSSRDFNRMLDDLFGKRR